jgi:predicted nucleic acid-binding protein
MYIDANIFIFAALDNGDIGKKARELLKRIEDRRLVASVSPLVFDEVVWVVQKISGRDDAQKIGYGLLSLPLSWLDIGYSSIQHSMNSYKVGLNPRDALHIGIMTDYDINVIISEDKDFDKIQSIKRKTIEMALKENDEQTKLK